MNNPAQCFSPFGAVAQMMYQSTGFTGCYSLLTPSEQFGNANLSQLLAGGCLLLHGVPSLSRCIGTGCASAQDDSQFWRKRGKEGGCAAFFSPLYSSRGNVILSAAKDLVRKPFA
jgi:hypothetical protein